MRDSSIEPLKKQMHEAEVEVDAIECKIQSADLKTTYSQEYNAMRAEQEQHRQHALKAKARTNGVPFDEGRTQPWKEGWIAADINMGLAGIED